MSRLLDLDEFLDPKNLTPRDFYRMQSETWAQGADYERERILKMLEEWVPEYYATSPNDDAVKYPIETVIEMIKDDK